MGRNRDNEVGEDPESDNTARPAGDWQVATPEQIEPLRTVEDEPNESQTEDPDSGDDEEVASQIEIV